MLFCNDSAEGVAVRGMSTTGWGGSPSAKTEKDEVASKAPNSKEGVQDDMKNSVSRWTV